MTALAHEHDAPEAKMPHQDLDEVLWQAWKAMELPEGYRAEIVEGFIEVSPTGRYSHSRIVNRLRDRLSAFLAGSEYAARQDVNVIHGRKVWIPDVFVLSEDDDGQYVTEDGLGVDASAVPLVVEVVPPGHDSTARDRVRKRRAYARAGIPVYVLVDDYDGHGTVSVLTSPIPGEARYTGELRVQYGSEVVIPEGPAKGFVIDEAITGPPRNAIG
ncbi:Uma2 family endonuclease [Streptomyces sp. NPDC086023]|uniref:Uma2 family endonuclease n=1 Tax=Streptomyces sp. NPDC086023 TaxID=3365746 RepID=UPI0037CD241D